jgi:hypothetical protein
MVVSALATGAVVCWLMLRGTTLPF